MPTGARATPLHEGARPGFTSSPTSPGLLPSAWCKAPGPSLLHHQQGAAASPAPQGWLTQPLPLPRVFQACPSLTASPWPGCSGWHHPEQCSCPTGQTPASGTLVHNGAARVQAGLLVSSLSCQLLIRHRDWAHLLPKVTPRGAFLSTLEALLIKLEAVQEKAEKSMPSASPVPPHPAAQDKASPHLPPRSSRRQGESQRQGDGFCPKLRRVMDPQQCIHSKP